MGPSTRGASTATLPARASTPTVLARARAGRVQRGWGTWPPGGLTAERQLHLGLPKSTRDDAETAARCPAGNRAATPAVPPTRPATGPHPSISWSVLAASEERVE